MWSKGKTKPYKRKDFLPDYKPKKRLKAKDLYAKALVWKSMVHQQFSGKKKGKK